MNSSITLTEPLIERLATQKGGYTKATLNALGCEWDDLHHTGRKGWKTSLIGTTVSQEQYDKALAGRTVYNSKSHDRQHPLPRQVAQIFHQPSATISNSPSLSVNQTNFIIRHYNLDPEDVKNIPPAVGKRMIEVLTGQWDIQKRLRERLGKTVKT